MKFKDLVKLIKNKQQPHRIRLYNTIFEWNDVAGDYEEEKYKIRLTKLANIPELLDVEIEIVE